MQEEEKKIPITIYLPKFLVDRIEEEGTRCKRPRTRQIEYMLGEYLMLKDWNDNAVRRRKRKAVTSDEDR